MWSRGSIFFVCTPVQDKQQAVSNKIYVFAPKHNLNLEKSQPLSSKISMAQNLTSVVLDD